MTNKIFHGVVVVLSTMMFAAGCGGGGSAPLTEAVFCDQKATNECNGVAAKCVTTLSACKAKRVQACLDFGAQQQMHPSAAARPFRPERAGACLAKATDVYNNPTITPADRLDLDTVCAKVYSGSVKANAACTESDAECDQNANLICDTGFGVCTTKKNVGANANCNNPGETCPTGQYCTGTPRLCTPKVASGMACSDTMPCVDGQRCAGATDNTTCMAAVMIGGVCTSNADCRTINPDPAPYCDSFNGNICTAGFTPSTGNAECMQAFGGA